MDGRFCASVEQLDVRGRDRLPLDMDGLGIVGIGQIYDGPSLLDGLNFRSP